MGVQRGHGEAGLWVSNEPGFQRGSEAPNRGLQRAVGVRSSKNWQPQ